jgi:hypothetical protein
MSDEEIEDGTVRKSARDDRFRRDRSARLRRDGIKEISLFASFKEEKEGRERLKSARKLEKQKKRKGVHLE